MNEHGDEFEQINEGQPISAEHKEKLNVLDYETYVNNIMYQFKKEHGISTKGHGRRVTNDKLSAFGDILNDIREKEQFNRMQYRTKLATAGPINARP